MEGTTYFIATSELLTDRKLSLYLNSEMFITESFNCLTNLSCTYMNLRDT